VTQSNASGSPANSPMCTRRSIRPLQRKLIIPRKGVVCGLPSRSRFARGRTGASARCEIIL
jgi:hypothetical protein